MLSAGGAPIDFGLPGTSRVLVGAVLLAVLYSLVGLAVGAIVRSQPLAIVRHRDLAAAHRGDLRRHLPERRQVAAVPGRRPAADDRPAEDVLNPWVGAAYLAGVVAVLLVVGIVLVRRRDA